jgi:hypothetical protein
MIYFVTEAQVRYRPVLSLSHSERQSKGGGSDRQSQGSLRTPDLVEPVSIKQRNTHSPVQSGPVPDGRARDPGPVQS